MNVRLLFGLVWASTVLSACQQNHPQYDRYPAALMSPSAEIESWISPKDFPDITRRASSGNLECTVMLARYYLDTARDSEVGLRWLRAAAIRGDTVSKWNMSFELLRSADPKEQYEGIEWLRAASKDGDKIAVLELRRIEEQMTNQPQKPTPARFTETFGTKSSEG